MAFEAGKKSDGGAVSEHWRAPVQMQAMHKGKEVMDMSLAAIFPCRGAKTVSIHLKHRTMMNRCSPRKWFNRKVWRWWQIS